MTFRIVLDKSNFVGVQGGFLCKGAGLHPLLYEWKVEPIDGTKLVTIRHASSGFFLKIGSKGDPLLSHEASDAGLLVLPSGSKTGSSTSRGVVISTPTGSRCVRLFGELTLTLTASGGGDGGEDVFSFLDASSSTAPSQTRSTVTSTVARTGSAVVSVGSPSTPSAAAVTALSSSDSSADGLSVLGGQSSTVTSYSGVPLEDAMGGVSDSATSAASSDDGSDESADGSDGSFSGESDVVDVEQSGAAEQKKVTTVVEGRACGKVSVTGVGAEVVDKDGVAVAIVESDSPRRSVRGGGGGGGGGVGEVGGVAAPNGAGGVSGGEGYYHCDDDDDEISDGEMARVLDSCRARSAESVQKGSLLIPNGGLCNVSGSDDTRDLRNSGLIPEGCAESKEELAEGLVRRLREAQAAGVDLRGLGLEALLSSDERGRCGEPSGGAGVAAVSPSCALRGAGGAAAAVEREAGEEEGRGGGGGAADDGGDSDDGGGSVVVDGVCERVDELESVLTPASEPAVPLARERAPYAGGGEVVSASAASSAPPVWLSRERAPYAGASDGARGGGGGGGVAGALERERKPYSSVAAARVGASPKKGGGSGGRRGGCRTRQPGEALRHGDLLRALKEAGGDGSKLHEKVGRRGAAAVEAVMAAAAQATEALTRTSAELTRHAEVASRTSRPAARAAAAAVASMGSALSPSSIAATAAAMGGGKGARAVGGGRGAVRGVDRPALRVPRDVLPLVASGDATGQVGDCDGGDGSPFPCAPLYRVRADGEHVKLLCPQSHAVKAREHDRHVVCDVCRKDLRPPTATVVRCGRGCDYDLCVGCAATITSTLEGRMRGTTAGAASRRAGAAAATATSSAGVAGDAASTSGDAAASSAAAGPSCGKCSALLVRRRRTHTLCDMCGMSMQPGSVLGCKKRRCDFDVCEGCGVVLMDSVVSGLKGAAEAAAVEAADAAAAEAAAAEEVVATEAAAFAAEEGEAAAAAALDSIVAEMESEAAAASDEVTPGGDEEGVGGCEGDEGEGGGGDGDGGGCGDDDVRSTVSSVVDAGVPAGGDASEAKVLSMLECGGGCGGGCARRQRPATVCDVCERSSPAGSAVVGCARGCDYDLCEFCAEAFGESAVAEAAAASAAVAAVGGLCGDAVLAADVGAGGGGGGGDGDGGNDGAGVIGDEAVEAACAAAFSGLVEGLGGVAAGVEGEGGDDHVDAVDGGAATLLCSVDRASATVEASVGTDSADGCGGATTGSSTYSELLLARGVRVQVPSGVRLSIEVEGGEVVVRVPPQ